MSWRAGEHDSTERANTKLMCFQSILRWHGNRVDPAAGLTALPRVLARQAEEKAAELAAHGASSMNGSVGTAGASGAGGGGDGGAGTGAGAAEAVAAARKSSTGSEWGR